MRWLRSICWTALAGLPWLAWALTAGCAAGGDADLPDRCVDGEPNQEADTCRLPMVPGSAMPRRLRDETNGLELTGLRFRGMSEHAADPYERTTEERDVSEAKRSLPVAASYTASTEEGVSRREPAVEPCGIVETEDTQGDEGKRVIVDGQVGQVGCDDIHCVAQVRQEEALPRTLETIETFGPAEIVDSADASCCLEPCRVATWVFGAEATFLAPSLKSGDVQYVVDDLTRSTTSVFRADDVGSLVAGPRLWLGLQGPCWGVVGRYWHLRDAGSSHDPFIVEPFSFDSGSWTQRRFDAYAVDIELTRAFCHYDSKLTASVGARYASLEHDLAVSSRAAVDDDLLAGWARTARSSYGTGVTAALAGRKPLFCDSCAHLVFNVRGSVLWGSSQVGAETSALVVDPDGSGGAYNGAIANSSDRIFIGEVQLGIEWDYPLACLPANAFFRTVAEYQYWDAGRGHAAADSFADEVGVVQGTAIAEAGGLRTSLVGFTVGAGFTW